MDGPSEAGQSFISPRRRSTIVEYPSALALAALLVLAGCLSTPHGAPASPPPATASPFPLPWDLSGCRELAATFDADPAAVAPLLPPGFTPGGGMAPGRTSVGMDAFRCATGSGVRGGRQDVSYASFWATATPPDALKGDVRQWYVKWLAVVADPDSLAALREVNTTVTTGTVSYADRAPDPAGGTVATIQLDGVGAATITVGPEATGPSGGQGVALREFTPRPDGSVVVWQATLTRPTQRLGPGLLHVPAGSALATIAGRADIPVLVVDGGGGGLANGTIFPA